MSTDGCVLFGEDADDTLGASLRQAERDLDSRGTVDVAAERIEWTHGGVTVLVEQQAGFLADTSASVWVGSLATARWLEHAGPLGACLDLGSGTGVLGLWAMRAGLATTMVLTDRPSRVRPIQRNIQLNAPHVTPSTTSAMGLSWGTVPDGLRGRFNTVLAAELIYDHQLFGGLVATIAGLAAPRVVLSFGLRSEPDEQHFLKLLGAHYDCRLAHKCADEPWLRGYAVVIYDCRLRNAAATEGA